MKNQSEPLAFIIPLSSSAHRLAEQFQRQQTNPLKAKQVYLNTLAVFAVTFYLQCLGIETDEEASQSSNPVMQALMDVADLEIVGLGKLECRAVLPGAQVLYIPPEVWSDRIGYVAVQLDQSLQEATLLGFTKMAGDGEVLLSQLRSLAEFPEYLNQIRQATLAAQPVAFNSKTAKTAVNLSQWFEGIFETGWQTLEALFGTHTKNLVLVRDMTQFKPGVKRAKLLDLGMQLGQQAIVLAIALFQEDDRMVRVLVQIYPSRGGTYLPPQLRLTMLSESGEALQEVSSRSQDNYIQLRRFTGQTGDRFRLQVALEDVSITEAFVL